MLLRICSLKVTYPWCIDGVTGIPQGCHHSRFLFFELLKDHWHRLQYTSKYENITGKWYTSKHLTGNIRNKRNVKKRKKLFWLTLFQPNVTLILYDLRSNHLMLLKPHNWQRWWDRGYSLPQWSTYMAPHQTCRHVWDESVARYWPFCTPVIYLWPGLT